MSTSGKAGGPAVPVTVPNGGTGKTTLTAHGVVIGEGASAVNVTSAGTAGQVLTSNGAAADPTFQPSGGSTPGALIVRKFPFAFNTANLLTGATIYTPTVGDILFNVWIEIDTAWDGVTPQADVGSFAGNTGGLWFNFDSNPISLAFADTEDGGTGFLANVHGKTGDLIAAIGNSGAFGTGTPRGIGKFTTTAPIKVCVSTTGQNDGMDPGATHGAAIVYLVTATPV